MPHVEKFYIVETMEKRKYLVKAKSPSHARRYIKNKAKLEPKDKNIALLEFIVFEVKEDTTKATDMY